MALTPLHRALGERGGALTFAMIERACAEKIDERADLDWKKVLPLSDEAEGDDAGRGDELAKDIAAMANGDGGLIVYGVDEARGQDASHADRIVTVGEVGSSILKQIRQVANNLVYPPVSGLELTSLKSETSDESVLAMLVPSSDDAPHLVRPKGPNKKHWLAVPFRDGPETEWMVERQIEDAYRRRLEIRRARERDLHELHAGFVAGLKGRSWIALVARPVQPRVSRNRRLSPMAAKAILDRVWNRPGQILFFDLLRDRPVRPGLRRYRQQGDRRLKAEGRAESHLRAVAEIHDDGSVCLAYSRGGWFGPKDADDDRFLATDDFDPICMALFRLVLGASQSMRIASDYEIRLSVEGETPLFRRPDALIGYYQAFSAEDRLPPLQPIDGYLPVASGDPYYLGEALLELARDACNQVGWHSALDASELGNQLILGH